MEAVESGSVYVHCDVTAIFPWLTHALLSDPKIKRKPRRLMDLLGEATNLLDREVEKRRARLMKTLDWKVEEVRRRPRVFVR
jgi:deoxyhypusine synthase